MTDESLKKKYGSISTEKYYPIRNMLGVSSLSALLLTIFNTAPIVDCSLFAVFILNYLSFFSMSNCYAIDFTKSYVELEDEYKLFLNNYRDLMNSLDINSLASLCGAFYYLYKHGYLSIDGHYDSDSEDFFDGRRFQLVNIFNGCGICRHTANSLKDILNYCGYPSAGLPVYTRKYEKYTEEDIANMKKTLLNLFGDVIRDENLKAFSAEAFLNMELLLHQFDLDNQVSSEDYSEEKRRIAVSAGNHLTVVTSDKNESIVYDPTDNYFYQFKNKKSCDIINMYGMRMEYRLDYIKSVNTPSEEKILYQNLKLHPMSLVGLHESQDEAEKRIKDNLDMIDRFRKDNLPLMHTLKDKAYKLVN